MDLVLLRRGVLTLFLLFHVAVLHTAADVITLTTETFTDKVKEQDTVWFVQFCVPWCKHCKNMGTVWEDLGRAMEGEDEIEIGQVDCSLDKPVCSKVDIHSYPTFKVFYDGEEVAKFKGPRAVDRTVESLRSFVLEEAEKAAQRRMEGDADSI